MARTTYQLAVEQLPLVQGEVQLDVVSRSYCMDAAGQAQVADEAWYIERKADGSWYAFDGFAQGDDGVVAEANTRTFPDMATLMVWMSTKQPFIYIERIGAEGDITEIYKAPKTEL